MKKITKTILAGIGLLISVKANSQNSWTVGGNSFFTVNQTILPNSNYLGSATGNSSFIHLGVSGNQDIFIDNDPSRLLAPESGTTQPLGGHWVGLGRVFMPTLGTGSNANFTPQAHLHIHGGNNTPGFSVFTASLRPWFQTGTLYSENSDAMYVGMRDLFPATNLVNSSYAVINWSDDRAPGNGTDYLSFNFTGVGGGLASTNDGMELGRFDPSAGTFGVGNFMKLGYYTEPVRRVEILDADPNSGNNINAPQLRLTYSYAANPANGIFSEFQSTNSGDLYINTHDASQAAPYSDRFTGFHTPTPKNTIEINSQLANATSNDANVPASWAGGTGASGLRFTDLTSNSTITPTTTTNGIDSKKVLSVDKNGDVVLINAAAISTDLTNNGITTLPATGNTPATIQLGVDCGNFNFNNLGQAQLTTRLVPLTNKSLVFYDAATANLNGNPQSELMIVNFELLGPQYVNINRFGKYISIYNMSHALVKTISLSNVPTNTNGSTGDVLYLSQQLFNTDSKIEFMCLAVTSGLPHYTYYTGIYNEDGTLLFSDTGYAAVRANYAEQQYPIYNTPVGTKMIISYSNGQAKVFNLGGTLTTAEDKVNTTLVNNNMLSNAYPNPTNNTTTVEYTLPKGNNQGELIFYNTQGTEVKRFKVDNTFSSLLISTSDIAAGTYYYQLQIGGNASGTKKLVVVK